MYWHRDLIQICVSWVAKEEYEAMAETLSLMTLGLKDLDNHQPQELQFLQLLTMPIRPPIVVQRPILSVSNLKGIHPLLLRREQINAAMTKMRNQQIYLLIYSPQKVSILQDGKDSMLPVFSPRVQNSCWTWINPG